MLVLTAIFIFSVFSISMLVHFGNVCYLVNMQSRAISTNVFMTIAMDVLLRSRLERYGLGGCILLEVASAILVQRMGAGWFRVGMLMRITLYIVRLMFIGLESEEAMTFDRLLLCILSSARALRS